MRRYPAARRDRQDPCPCRSSGVSEPDECVNGAELMWGRWMARCARRPHCDARTASCAARREAIAGSALHCRGRQQTRLGIEVVHERLRTARHLVRDHPPGSASRFRVVRGSCHIHGNVSASSLLGPPVSRARSARSRRRAENACSRVAQARVFCHSAGR